jgi:NADPH-dependent 7-cyano-7-deazaguanine reductase QueF
VKACAPREAIVSAQFSARGGIALTVRAEYPDEHIGKEIAQSTQRSQRS